MRKAITISVLFHAALLTWALGYFGMGSDAPKPVTTASVPVDIMTPSQFTKIKAGEKKAPKKPKKQAEKKEKPVVKKKKSEPKKPPKKVKKVKPKPKPAKKAAKPKPKPKPVTKAKAKPKSKPKPVAKAKPKPKPKPKPRKQAKPKPKPKPKKTVRAKPRPKPQPVKKQPVRRTSEFDPDNIAALLNKLPDKPAPKAAPALRPAPVKQRQAAVAPPVYGRSHGADTTMSANEIDAFKAQISQCWRPPTGGLGSRDLNVKLRIKFKPDGTLARPPELANFSGSPFFRPAAEAAKRAVWQCQPYRMPKDKYATWQDMILNFDPRDMFGG